MDVGADVDTRSSSIQPGKISLVNYITVFCWNFNIIHVRCSWSRHHLHGHLNPCISLWPGCPILLMLTCITRSSITSRKRVGNSPTPRRIPCYEVWKWDENALEGEHHLIRTSSICEQYSRENSIEGNNYLRKYCRWLLLWYALAAKIDLV